MLGSGRSESSAPILPRFWRPADTKRPPAASDMFPAHQPRPPPVPIPVRHAPLPHPPTVRSDSWQWFAGAGLHSSIGISGAGWFRGEERWQGLCRMRCPQIFSTDVNRSICKTSFVVETSGLAAQRITSVAWKRMVGGMVRPSAWAVLRLITSSNFVGCSTGRSAGLAPLRILST